ncbi:MAG: PEPxxWA-CTERM sorting domain-containing protein [Proteobacteria bacterium]|nr:PEPxxWA-CTERM sorting domain-containing protein [Pseudomonadota bacterium]
MTLNLDMYLGYPDGADAYGLADFSHTVIASYDGPQGATTLSASGLFPGTLALDASPGAVPEPAAWALLIVGFGLSGAMLRRRRLARA